MYGVINAVAAPVEAYDRVHAEALKRAGSSIDSFGLLVHVGRATADGYEVLNIWESKEHYERAMEAVGELVPEMADEMARPPAEQEIETFEVRGLIIPRGDIVV